MKTQNRRSFLQIVGSGMLCSSMLSSSQLCSAEASEFPALLAGFSWIEHAAFRIEVNGKVIYFDPYKITASKAEADFIFISHEHGDHCSLTDVRKIIKDSSKIITEPDSAKKLNTYASQTTTMAPGDKLELDGFKIEAVRSYNINKTNHPKSKNWLGFIVTLPDGRTVYHAGDTDVIPEMKTIKTDIAMLPCGGKYTMNADEAAQAARDIAPKIVIPMHYGTVVGTKADADKLAASLKNEIEVFVFEKGQSIPPLKVGANNWEKL